MSQVALQPFPHLVIHDALPEDEYRRLSETFPATQGLAQNQRRNLKARVILEAIDVAPEWREFVRYHTSQGFAAEVRDLFVGVPGVVWGGRVVREFPHVRRIGLRPATRDGFAAQVQFHAFADMDVAMQGSAGAETAPVGPHTDNSNKLFSCLFYMRSGDDFSDGGSLYLSRWKHPGPDWAIASARSEGRVDEARDTEVVIRVPYRSNTVVIFPNSIRAVHGVEPRQGAVTPRRFCFISLFATNWDYTRPPFERRIKLIVGRAVRSAHAIVRRGGKSKVPAFVDTVFEA
jgi:hypothetical protein